MLFILNLIAIMDVSLSEEDDYEQLITRANSYEKAECDSNETNTKSTPKKACTKYFFKCQEHDDKKEWSTVNSECDKCIYFHLRETLPSGRLPTKKEVLSFMLTHNKLARGEWTHVNMSLSYTYAMDLRLHWIFCNVYPQCQKTVKLKLDHYLKDFHE